MSITNWMPSRKCHKYHNFAKEGRYASIYQSGEVMALDPGGEVEDDALFHFEGVHFERENGLRHQDQKCEQEECYGPKLQSSSLA